MKYVRLHVHNYVRLHSLTITYVRLHCIQPKYVRLHSQKFLEFVFMNACTVTYVRLHGKRCIYLDPPLVSDGSRLLFHHVGPSGWQFS